ncbi:MAG: HD domain-containing phosphohydrolase [Microcoleaceae cyanobacterium]
MVCESPQFQQALTERTELIEQLLDIGAALSGTQDLGTLLNLILTKSRDITNSDAGSVYLVDRRDHVPKLLFKAAQNASIPDLSFREFAIPLTDKSLAGYVAVTGETLNLPDAYDLPSNTSYQLDCSFDQMISYRTRSVLILPMQNLQGEILGVLQLINRKTDKNVILSPDNTLASTLPFSEWEERILRSLASQAAVSIERNQLQGNIEHLFEGFVKASVQVIEQRDPCTSGHSERVAELTVRLCEEVNQVDSGILTGYHFNQQQRKELRYAALLHDFGKIGVPEAVLRKSKKLYNEQLEVIRHRFALAQRSVELEKIEAKYQLLLQASGHDHNSTGSCSACQQVEQVETHFSEVIDRLSHYWRLLQVANEPQVLDQQPFAGLDELSEMTYRDIDGSLKPLITPAELQQLQVLRGNLTAEERLVMESHVNHTYEFLKRIPWTTHLQQVPIIASGHHEKLDGTGYPLGLTQDEIPLQAQMMAIADIYDALTAGDRPYKRGLPTITAIKILRQEALNNKVNSDLLLLFEQRQVYQVLGHSLDVLMKLA